MKITVTGASSFIGKRLLLRIAKKHEVTAVIRKGSGFFWPGVRLIYCDMDNYGKLGTICGTGDVFINLTWNGSRGADRQNKDLQESNYQSTLAAMQSMAEAGYTTLVSAGSQAEYGNCDGIITEETPLLPNTEYGIYKKRIYEEVGELASKAGCRFIEPRYFSLYGPGDYEKTLIMATLKKLLRNETVALNECTQLWDYLYVDDAMDALAMLCETDAPTGAYNFATGQHRTLREFILEMKEAVNSKSEIIFGAVEYNGLYIDLRPNVEKLKAIGWKPATLFKDGIRRIAEKHERFALHK